MAWKPHDNRPVIAAYLLYIHTLPWSLTKIHMWRMEWLEAEKKPHLRMVLYCLARHLSLKGSCLWLDPCLLVAQSDHDLCNIFLSNRSAPWINPFAPLRALGFLGGKGLTGNLFHLCVTDVFRHAVQAIRWWTRLSPLQSRVVNFLDLCTRTFTKHTDGRAFPISNA